MKKLPALLLSLVLLLTAVSATAGDTGTPEPITVTFFKGEPGEQPSADNKIYRMIEEELGIRFEFEFLTTFLDEALGMKTLDEASLPDLLDGSNSGEWLEDNHILIDLLPYINEEETPNLYRHLYTDDRIRELVTEDGKLYIIPNYGISYNGEIKDQDGPAFFIQKQVVAWNNYRVPKTLNEYFDLIERFLAEHPVNEAGEAYTGFAILCESWKRFSLINPVQHLMGHPNEGEVIVGTAAERYKTETFIDKPYAKPYYRKLNEAFDKGLISEDTFIMGYDQYIAALSGGTVLGMFDQTWDLREAAKALQDAGKYGNTYLAIPLVYDPEYVDGAEIEEHYINGTVMNKDRGAGITINCRDPERMVRMYDTLLSDEWQKLLQWGTEGEDYYVENGRMLMTREQYEQRSNAEWQRANTANALWISLPKKQGHMDDGNAWSPDQQPEIRTEVMNDYDREFLEKCGKRSWNDFFNPPAELPPYGEAWEIDKNEIDEDYQTFLKIQDRCLPEIIMCDPDEFDAEWDAFTAEIAPYAATYADFMHREILKLAGQVAD